jgi:hypothetical protein
MSKMYMIYICVTVYNLCFSVILVQFNLICPKDISEMFGESHRCENLKFEYFDKS